MCQVPPLLTDVVRIQSLEVLNGQFLAASTLFERMIGSSRNVIGADFIMIDEGCGQVACLMTACCDQIAARMQELGSPAGWPVRPVPDQAFDGVGAAQLPDNPDNEGVTGTLDAFGQSVLEAVSPALALGDRQTADLLTRLWRDIERQLWQSVQQPVMRVQMVLLID